MKAITLYQPWATLMAMGAKKIETRGWSTSYRGPLAIHAGRDKRFIDMRSKHYVCGEEPFASILKKELERISLQGWNMYWMPRGAIVAVVNLKDCVRVEIPWHYGATLSSQELAFGDYTPGRFIWITEGMRQLNRPVPASGRRRLWDWDPPEGFEF